VANCKADWSILDLPKVTQVISQAAKRAHRRYEDTIDLEDLEQEATIMVVTKAPLQEAARGEEPGLLQYRLEQDLGDWLLPRAKQKQRTVSYDELLENADDAGYIAPYVVIETASNDYSRESVETLLPAVWDESYLYGLPQREDAPDPEMPKGSSNKAQGNNLSAYIADIKTGWEKTPLTTKERRALILAFGLGWTHKEIAYNQGVSRQAITQRIETAIGKICARLNGGSWHEANQEELA
jgi:predicted DNA-binding protein (UPF0251 family)